MFRRLFSYSSPEQRVSARHPRRNIRERVREVLSDLDREFRTRHSTTGRPSIPPEQLLSALRRHMCDGVRRDRQLMEQLDYNLLSRWFVGLSPDDAVWDATTVTKNRERLQAGDSFNRFMENLLNHKDVRPLREAWRNARRTAGCRPWRIIHRFEAVVTPDGDGENVHGTTRTPARPTPTAAGPVNQRARSARAATGGTPRWRTETASPSRVS